MSVLDITPAYPDLWAYDAYYFIDEFVMLPPFWAFNCVPLRLSYHLPSTGGIYFIASRTRKVCYIGQAVNFRNRIKTHDKFNGFDYYQCDLIYYFEVVEDTPAPELLNTIKEIFGKHHSLKTIIERFYILMYRPPLNRLHGPNSGWNYQEKKVIGRLHNILNYYRQLSPPIIL